jgi:mannose-6-phosphate isomerase-like protein (cupin superfamily)
VRSVASVRSNWITPCRPGSYTAYTQFIGITQHDLYHAGQIVLLKKARGDRANDERPDRSGVIRLADARARIPGPAGEHAVSLWIAGTLKIKLSCPVRPNQQAPHTQDEVYVIVRGRGVLFHDGKRDEFGPGDLMFVAAGRSIASRTSATT